MNSEVRGVFGPSTSAQSGDGTQPEEHDDLIDRATRLVNNLRQDPLGVTARHSRHGRKRRRMASPVSFADKEIQRKLIVINYPGPSPPEVTVLHEYDKVFDGIVRFSLSTTEADLREAISSLIQVKYTKFYSLWDVGPEDFEFVKVINKRIRKPDGEPLYNGNGIKEMYKTGAIYVRLTKCVDKHAPGTVSMYRWN